MELLGVVEVQPLGHALDRPIASDAAGSASQLSAERHGRYTARPTVALAVRAPNGTPRHSASGHRLQWSAKAAGSASRDAVDRDHIDQRVVDLDKRQRPGCAQRTCRGSEAIARGLPAGSFCHTSTDLRCPIRKLIALRLGFGKSQCPAAALHLDDQIADARPLAVRGTLVDRGLHHLIDFGRSRAVPVAGRDAPATGS